MLLISLSFISRSPVRQLAWSWVRDQEKLQLQFRGILVLGQQCDSLLCAHDDEIRLGYDANGSLTVLVHATRFLDDSLVCDVITRLLGMYSQSREYLM